MALRKIVVEGDPVLRKICRPVEKFDARLHMLLDDMADTMYEAEGVGLAAPQVAVLRRVVVIDVGDENGLIEMINPKIVYDSREQVCDAEGCLSVPGERGLVSRPKKVVCEYFDRNGEKKKITGEDFLARAICHELDHLDGRLYIDIAERMLDDDED
ncbi:MAG: peptide deformylase [Oscillospiraceae bacterium]|nr:peptide deformylase [Oscillospiraceae bacterium]